MWMAEIGLRTEVTKYIEFLPISSNRLCIISQNYDVIYYQVFWLCYGTIVITVKTLRMQL